MQRRQTVCGARCRRQRRRRRKRERRRPRRRRTWRTWPTRSRCVQLFVDLCCVCWFSFQLCLFAVCRSRWSPLHRPAGPSGCDAIPPLIPASRAWSRMRCSWRLSSERLAAPSLRRRQVGRDGPSKQCAVHNCRIISMEHLVHRGTLRAREWGMGHSSIGHMLAAACELELRQDTLVHATSTASSNCCQQSFRLTCVATDVLLCAQKTTCSSGLTRRWMRPTWRRRRICRTCWPVWARRSAKLTGALDCVYHNRIGWSGCCCKLLG